MAPQVQPQVRVQAPRIQAPQIRTQAPSLGRRAAGSVGNYLLPKEDLPKFRKLGEFLQEIPRGAARIFNTARESAIRQGVKPRVGEFTVPQGGSLRDKALRVIFGGQEKVGTSTEDARKLAGAALNENVGNALPEPAVYLAGLALNSPGLGKPAREVLERLAKRRSKSAIKEIAEKTVGKSLDDNVVSEIARTSDPKQVEAILQKAAKVPQTPRVRITPQTKANNVFDNKTEIPQINRILENKDTVGTGQKIADYYRTAKGEDWGVRMMTPDEYLEQSARAMGKNTPEEIASWAKTPMGDVNKYTEAMRKGDKFPMPWINQVTGSQEGRSRALAAKQLGMEEIPVAVATTPQQARLIDEVTEAITNPAARSDITENIPPVKEAAPTPITESTQAAQEAGERFARASGEQERGFATTVRESEKTFDELAERVDSTYTVKPNAELVREVRNVVRSSPNRAREIALAETSDRGTALGTELIKLYQDRGEYGLAAEMAESLAERLTEAGRAVQAASLYNKLSPAGILQYAARKSDIPLTGEVAETLTAMSKAIDEMPPGLDKQVATFKMLEYINSLKPSPAVDKIMATWKAGLLTAPTTTAGNILGNTTKAILEKLSDAPAAVFDKIFSVFTGKRTKVFTTRGVVSGGAEGASKGWRFLRTGFDQRNVLNKYDHRNINFGNSKLGQAAEGYVNGVFRLMGAQDQPFYYGSLRNSLYDQAIAAAKTQGLKGDSYRKFVGDFVDNPSSQAMSIADRDAKSAVFQNKTTLGAGAAGLKRGLSSAGPAGKFAADFILPFSQVPSAVASSVIQYSPVGVIGEVFRQVRNVRKGQGLDQRLLSQALGDATVGTAGIMSLGAVLQEKELITLGYPQDDTERKLWEQEGKQPYSIKIGDKWRSMNYVQPFGTLLALGAQFAKSRGEGEGVGGSLVAAGASAAKSITEQSFLRGVSGALQAVNEPDRAGQQFLEQTAGSIVPNVIGRVTAAFDPMQREIEGALDAVKADIPGLRDNLTVRRDSFGQQLENAQSPVGTLLDPFRTRTPQQEDPELVSELRRLQDSGFGTMPSTLREKDQVLGDLSQQQLDRLEETVNQPIRQAWSDIVRSSEYQQAGDEQRQKMLRDASTDIRAAARVRFAQEQGVGDPQELAGKLDRNQASLLSGQGYSLNAAFDIPDNMPEDSKNFLIDYERLNPVDRDAFFKGDLHPWAQSLTDKVNATEWEGLPEFKPNNRLAYETAKFEKEMAEKEYSDVEKYSRTKGFLKDAIKTQYDEKIGSIPSLTQGEVKDMLERGTINRDEMAKALEMDDAMLKAGLRVTPEFSSKFRIELGFGNAYGDDSTYVIGEDGQLKKAGKGRKTTKKARSLGSVGATSVKAPPKVKVTPRSRTKPGARVRIAQSSAGNSKRIRIKL